MVNFVLLSCAVINTSSLFDLIYDYNIRGDILSFHVKATSFLSILRLTLMMIYWNRDVSCIAAAFSLHPQEDFVVKWCAVIIACIQSGDTSAVAPLNVLEMETGV